MQTISDELTASLAKKNPVYKKVVELHRRIWSGGVYIYDAAVDITDQVKQYSPVRWKFDSEAFNVWTLDNTSIVFRNDRNQWKQDNPIGYFSGNYVIADSKIVIKFGAELADGTFEVVKSFTGYIATDPISDTTGKYINVTIQGGMSIFSKTSAELISTLVEDELLGEDSGTVFTTANNGVGVIVIVKRGVSLAAATEIKPVTDYSLSDLNQKNLPLTVTLVSDLTAGEDLYISYRYWYQDKTLDWIVKEALTLNGIADHSGVVDAVFESSIENLWDFNSQADWETCGLSSINTTIDSGSFLVGLVDDFRNNDYTTGPTWTVLQASGVIAASAASKSLTSNLTNGVANVIKLPSLNKTTGTWAFALGTSPYLYGGYARAYLMANGFVNSGTAQGWLPSEGYYVEMAPWSDSYSYIRLYRVDANVNAPTLMIETYMQRGLTIRVDRNAAGDFELFANNVSVGTASNNTYTTNTIGFCFAGLRNSTPASTQTLYNLYYFDPLTTVGQGILTSPVKDCGASLTSWGKLLNIYTANGATVLIETYSSGTIDFSADNDPAGWVSIDGVGQIQSAIKRYLKYRVTASIASLTSLLSPAFDQITVKYYTSTTVIDLVDLTGMNCFQLLSELAMMPAYEIGMDASETFNYRPRSTDVPPVIELRSDTNVKNIRNITDGRERVKNRIVAEFGIYRKVSDASADAQPNSIDKYGTQEYNVPPSNLLPAENVNIAYAIAPTILAYAKTPRKRCTVDAMFLPQLELGDKVTLYYNEPSALRRWLWGDTDVVYGQADLEYYDDGTLLNRYNFWGTIMRVEGLEFNPSTFLTRIDLVEVL